MRNTLRGRAGMGRVRVRSDTLRDFAGPAATLSTTLAIICGTVALVASVVGGGQNVQLGIAGTGPVVTTAGAALCVLGVLGNSAGRRQ